MRVNGDAGVGADCGSFSFLREGADNLAHRPRRQRSFRFPVTATRSRVKAASQWKFQPRALIQRVGKVPSGYHRLWDPGFRSVTPLPHTCRNGPDGLSQHSQTAPCTLRLFISRRRRHHPTRNHTGVKTLARNTKAMMSALPFLEHQRSHMQLHSATPLGCEF